MNVNSEPLSMHGLPAARAAATQSARTRHEYIRRSGSVVAVWRDALSTFSARSAAILFCALVGFAVPIIVGRWISTSATVSAYMRTRLVEVLYDKPSTAICLQGSRIFKTYCQVQRALSGQFLAALFVQTVVGLLALTFARGAITWMALHGAQVSEERETCGSFGEACRMTLAHYPALLASTLFYGAIVTASIVGFSELTQPLEYNRSTIAHVWAGVARNFSDVRRQLTWLSLNALIPDPGPPFAEFVPVLRNSAFKQFTQATFYEQQLAEQYGEDVMNRGKPNLLGVPSNYAREIWLIVLTSTLFIFLTETLLRFRTVMALNPFGSRRPERVGLLAPLIASARFGLRHFGAITVHVWIVRLAIFALSVAFIEFPLAVVDNLIVPYARPGSNFELLPIMGFLEISGAALVGTILTAFSVVYDARLFEHLLHACGEET